MSDPFFKNGIPDNYSTIDSFFDRYSRASAKELDLLSSEFSRMSSEEIVRVDTHLLANKKCDASLLSLICDALPPIHALDMHALGLLLLESYKNFITGKYIQEDFELNTAKLINGYRPANPDVLLSNLASEFSSGLSFVNAKDKKNEALTLKSDAMDKAYAKQLRMSMADAVTENMVNGLCFVSMPLTMDAMVDRMISSSDIYGLRKVIGSLYKTGSLTPAYIDVFRKYLDDEDILEVCRVSSSHQVSLKSTYVMNTVYGEHAIFDEDRLTRIQGIIERGSFPTPLDVIHDPLFDSEKLRPLSKLIVDNLEKIYEIHSASATFKQHLLHFACRQGQAERALACELGKLITPLRRIDSMDKIDEMSLCGLVNRVHELYVESAGSDYELEYVGILHLLSTTTLESAATILKEVNGKIVSDYIDQYIDPSDKSRRQEIMKLYPQAKSRILENDLGL